jgi:hypothetical protein
VQFCQWWKGFEAKQFFRRWQDRGSMLLVHSTLFPDLEAWMRQPIAMYASIHSANSRGVEAESEWQSSRYEFRLN